MKPSMHTKEWLRWARGLSGLSRTELADLTGLSRSTIVAAETGGRGGAPETWAAIDAVLYPLTPIAYVNEDSIVDYVRRCSKSAGRKKCRLYYTAGAQGLVFTEVRPEHDDGLSGAYIVVTWAEAETLLEEQKAIFE